MLRCENDTELCHYAEYGGTWTSRAAGDEKFAVLCFTSRMSTGHMPVFRLLRCHFLGFCPPMGVKCSQLLCKIFPSYMHGWGVGPETVNFTKFGNIIYALQGRISCAFLTKLSGFVGMI